MNKKFLGNILILLAVLLGLASGLSEISLLNQGASVTSDLFLRLLKLISLPIIFLSITSTISGMQDFHEMKKMGRRVLTYTVATTVLAATVALVLFLIINPAKNPLPLAEGGTDLGKQESYLSFFMNIIPGNLFQAFVENNVIGVAFIAFAVSIATLFLPKEHKNFLHQLFSSLFAATLKLTSAVIVLMPFAVWAFVTILMKDLQHNYEHLSTLLWYLGAVVAANLVQGFVVLPTLLKFKGISPWKSFRGMSPALTLAFLSKSSSATLPVTMQSLEKNLGVSKKVSSFTLPLCSVINMNGCAAFILISVLFVSMLNGYTFGALDYIGWIFLATIAAIGNAGVPMGCFFLTSAFLVGMNIPLYIMGLILPFYTILDMIETALNVWSDGCVALIVEKDLVTAEVPVAIQSETL